jgi:hypothetical protein
VDPWCDRIERDETTVTRWRYVRSAPIPSEALIDDPPNEEADALLFLTHRRGEKVVPFHDEVSFREKDESDVVIVENHREMAEGWLRSRGWAPVQPAGVVRPDEASAAP